MHSGVCCCVSYIKTESCVATAYTILYGNENAALIAAELEGVVDPEGAEVGASLSVFIAGGGKAVMFSSPEEVSTVICLVATADLRMLYLIGEQLTAIEGFLWPGRCAMGGLFRPARV